MRKPGSTQLSGDATAHEPPDGIVYVRRNTNLPYVPANPDRHPTTTNPLATKTLHALHTSYDGHKRMLMSTLHTWVLLSDLLILLGICHLCVVVSCNKQDSTAHHVVLFVCDGNP